MKYTLIDVYKDEFLAIPTYKIEKVANFDEDEAVFYDNNAVLTKEDVEQILEIANIRDATEDWEFNEIAEELGFYADIVDVQGDIIDKDEFNNYDGLFFTKDTSFTIDEAYVTEIYESKTGIIDLGCYIEELEFDRDSESVEIQDDIFETRYVYKHPTDSSRYIFLRIPNSEGCEQTALVIDEVDLLAKLKELEAERFLEEILKIK